MPRKKHGLIDELKDSEDATPIIKTGDMQRGSNFASWPRVFFYTFLYTPLGLMSLGLIIYKVFFAMSSQSLWLNILFYIACAYIFWIVVKWCMFTYVQVRSKGEQLYEWRPRGVHIMWTSKGHVEGEGEITFPCPHCHQGSHRFKLFVRREVIEGINYVPAFFDPLFATRIEYNRTMSVPAVCPLTKRSLDGKFNVRQTSHNPVTEIEIVGLAD